MKLFSISLLLLCGCMFGGCIAEDTDSCPPEFENNLILKFLYTNDKNEDIFEKNIRQVDVFIYDNQERLVQKKSVDQSMLKTFTGTQLFLEPGTYRIVCWANALDKTAFGKVAISDFLKDAFLNNSGVDVNNITSNGDPLHYTPYPKQAFMLTVLEGKQQTAEISFCSAHIKIMVYVKGFEDKSGNDNLPPLIQLTDIPVGYNFERQASNNLTSYMDIANYQIINDQNLAVLEFDTPLFGVDTPSQLQIKKQSDGSVLTSINLKDFIKDNNISLDDNQQVVIPILIEYKSVGVSISFPGWSQKPIAPGL